MTVEEAATALDTFTSDSVNDGHFEMEDLGSCLVFNSCIVHFYNISLHQYIEVYSVLCVYIIRCEFVLLVICCRSYQLWQLMF